MLTYLQELEGKEIWGCQFFGTRINLQLPHVSLCHDVYAGERLICPLEATTPEIYYGQLLSIAADNASPNSHCRKCEKCHPMIWYPTKINWVTINTSWYCNSSCIYCNGHYAKEPVGYDVIDILNSFQREQLFDNSCLFDWGGGEPTLNNTFEATVRWIAKKGYPQRINTNAILYSEITEEALRRSQSCVRISVDAGTRNCFYRMKGHDSYNEVWNNIKKYRRITSNIYIKYNVCNYNSDLAEIDAFLDCCQASDIEHIIIDGEINSYQPKENAGIFYYTEKEFLAMHYLRKKAKEHGLDVSISDYAFSYRSEYDSEGDLCLPSKYIDNIDRNIISQGIYVETFPTIQYLLHEVSKASCKIFLWGYGKIGKIIYQILQENSIPISAIIDCDAAKKLDVEKGIPFWSPEKFLGCSELLIVILGGRFWRDMLKDINRYKMFNCRPIYMRDIHYTEYVGSGSKIGVV